MEKIKLGSGKELELVISGVASRNGKVDFSFLLKDYTLPQIEEILSDESETVKMILLSDIGDQIQVFNGYTELNSIALIKNQNVSNDEDDPVADVISVTMARLDNTSRIKTLETRVDDTEAALQELKEMTNS